MRRDVAIKLHAHQLDDTEDDECFVVCEMTPHDGFRVGRYFGGERGGVAGGKGGEGEEGGYMYAYKDTHIKNSNTHTHTHTHTHKQG